jgi:glutathione synthase/RimK-type ligase-like ATP-grasp enzyme
MKLSIAVATCAKFPDLYGEDQVLCAALNDRGVATTPLVWNDPGADWDPYDAVLVRSTWDYSLHYPAFRAWLDRLDALGVPLINDSALIRWNSDKEYLAELLAAGVDVVPTAYASHADLVAVTRSWPYVVVKPTVGGNSWNTVRGAAGDPAFEALPVSLRYVVQPYLTEIVDEGEWSLMFFGGEFSHAVIKRPAAGDFRVQLDFGGTSERAYPSPEMTAAARAVLDATERLGHATDVYARVDGVRTGGRFLLMELEMIEPYLFLEYAEGSTARMADAVTRRCRRLGHRRDAARGTA